MGANERDLPAKAERVLPLGKTSAGLFLPLKVTDDGSGLGKLVVVLE